MTEFLSLIDVLDIPRTMSPYLSPVWLIGMALVPFLFVLSILTEQAKTVKGEYPQYNTVIYNAVLVIFGMFIYRYIFIKIVALCEGISMSVINMGDWHVFTTVVKNAQEKTGLLRLLNINPITAIHCLSTTFMLVVEVIFLIVRYVFLAVLYVIGPISFVFGIYGPTRSLIKSWFLSTVQVAFWIVVFRIIQAVLLSFHLASYIEKGNVVITVVATLSFIFMAVATPVFTSKLFSGQNIGLIGSTLIAGATYITGRLGMAGAKGAAKGGVTRIGKTRVGQTISTVGKTAIGQIKHIPERVKRIWQKPYWEVKEEPPKTERKR